MNLDLQSEVVFFILTMTFRYETCNGCYASFQAISNKDKKSVQAQKTGKDCPGGIVENRFPFKYGKTHIPHDHRKNLICPSFYSPPSYHLASFA